MTANRGPLLGDTPKQQFQEAVARNRKRMEEVARKVVEVFVRTPSGPAVLAELRGFAMCADSLPPDSDAATLSHFEGRRAVVHLIDRLIEAATEPPHGTH